MQLRRSQQFAGEILQQTPALRRELWGILLLSLLLYLWKAGSLLFLLKWQNLSPIAYFGSHFWQWKAIQLALGLPAALLQIWLRWRFWLHCADAMGGIPHRQPLPSGRMLGLGCLQFLLRTAWFQSMPLCLWGAAQLAQESAAHAESAPWLFGAMQLVVLGVLCFWSWLYGMLGLWGMPFVWFQEPTLPPWRVPMRAMQILRGKRLQLLELLGWYGVQLLPVVTIPWVLPQGAVSVGAFYLLEARSVDARSKRSLKNVANS